MPAHSEDLIVLPPASTADKLDDYRRRIDRFREHQLAARARAVEAQRRFRLFTSIVIGGLLLTAAISVYVAYSLSRLKQTVAAQLQSAQQAVAASNDRWRYTRQALAEDRKALETSTAVLSSLRAESRAALLLPAVDSYLDQLRAAGRLDAAAVPLVSAPLKEAVRADLVRTLTANPETADARLLAELRHLIDVRLPAALATSAPAPVPPASR